MDTPGRKLLLACGAIGPPLFVAVFLLEGGTRPDYDPRRLPVSSLSSGERGWRQTANFLVAGALIVAFSRGVRAGRSHSASGTAGEARLLGLSGVGLVGAGLFATDPVFGYPPGSPLLLEQGSLSGHLHNLASVLFFVGVPGACFASFRRAKGAGDRLWATYSLLTIPAMLITFALAGVGFARSPRLVQNAGAIQRLSITTGLAWVALRAVRLLRASRA